MDHIYTNRQYYKKGFKWGEILSGELIVLLKWSGRTDLDLFVATGENKDYNYYARDYLNTETYDRSDNY